MFTHSHHVQSCSVMFQKKFFSQSEIDHQWSNTGPGFKHPKLHDLHKNADSAYHFTQGLFWKFHSGNGTLSVNRLRLHLPSSPHVQIMFRALNMPEHALCLKHQGVVKVFPELSNKNSVPSGGFEIHDPTVTLKKESVQEIVGRPGIHLDS